jgi:uncharacterized protein YggU (UPF0235/DUF167 family)
MKLLKNHLMNISQYKNGILYIPIKVTPKSSTTIILPFKEGDLYLKVKVVGAPEKGQVNTSLIDYLSDLLDIPKTTIGISSGFKSRNKIISIETKDPDLLLTRLTLDF